MIGTDFGSFLATRRKVCGLTQKQLGQKIGVSSQLVSKWECSDGMPDITYLVTLATELNLTLEQLVNCEKTAITNDSAGVDIGFTQERDHKNLLLITRYSRNIIIVLLAVFISTYLLFNLIVSVVYLKHSSLLMVQNYMSIPLVCYYIVLISCNSIYVYSIKTLSIKPSCDTYIFRKEYNTVLFKYIAANVEITFIVNSIMLCDINMLFMPLLVVVVSLIAIVIICTLAYVASSTILRKLDII